MTVREADIVQPRRGVARLLLAQIGQGRIGLALPAALGVPHRLAVAYGQEVAGGSGLWSER